MLTVVAEKNSGRSNSALLGNSHNGLGSEHGATGAAQGAVGGDVNAGLVAEVDSILLGKRGVVLDLVDGGNNGGLGQQLLEVLDTVVGDTDGLDLAGANELLHALPGGHMGVIVDDITRAIFELGEEGVVSWKWSAFRIPQLHGHKVTAYRWGSWQEASVRDIGQHSRDRG